MSDKPKIKNDPENYITVGMAQAKRRAEWLAEQDRLKIAAAIRRIKPSEAEGREG